MKTEIYSIPKIIHFIWAGGTTEIPQIASNVVKQWINNNPGMEVWLWTDPETFDGNDKIQKKYLKLFDNKIYIKDIREDLFHKIEENNPLARYIDVLKKIIIYEIEKTNPNYGASSDLLRYLVLLIYGGAYFDTDVAPGNISLEESKIFTLDAYEKHMLYIEHMPQQLTTDCYKECTKDCPENCSECNKLQRFSPAMAGNDAFISTKNNPFFEKLLIESI